MLPGNTFGVRHQIHITQMVLKFDIDYWETCKYVSEFGNSFLTVQNLEVVKNYKVDHFFCTVANDTQRTIMLDHLTQATYIQWEKNKKTEP